MEKVTDIALTLLALAIGVPIVIVFAGWAINVVHILWVIGDKMEKFIGTRIDKEIYDKHERLRKEFDNRP